MIMCATRFTLKQLSVQRIFNAIIRRAIDVPHVLAWYWPANKFKYKIKRMDDYFNRHSGHRCFIIGNGPSISGMDMSPLKDEFTFGLNRIYLLFNSLPFIPTYYVCVNELVLEQFSGEINALTMPKFLNWNRRKSFSAESDSTHFVRLALGLQDVFVRDFRRPLSSGGTVTYVALQIAYTMGFSEVVLIGVDHSFADKGIPNKIETRRSDTDVNHFHPDYFPKGSRWQLPDLKRSELAYALARRAYEKDGRRIIDATVNGKCTVFEKDDFYSLF
jgi:hypothetical protein